MTTKVVPGTLIATHDAAHAASEAASRMAKTIRTAIKDRGSAKIALSGGNTPRAAYAELARAEDVDWSRVDVFFVDERAVPPDHDRSNFKMVKKCLIGPARVPEGNVFRMAGESSDLDRVATEYQSQIAKRVGAKAAAPSFDLMLMGIGDDGHTASLFPGNPEIDVTDRFVVAVHKAPDGLEPRLTVTAPTIEAARSVIILAVGASKHEPLERVWAVAGDIRKTPARVMRGVRGGVTWVIDRAAGGMG
jgi:6-phosphogluconolactonase